MERVLSADNVRRDAPVDTSPVTAQAGGWRFFHFDFAVCRFSRTIHLTFIDCSQFDVVFGWLRNKTSSEAAERRGEIERLLSRREFSCPEGDP